MSSTLVSQEIKRGDRFTFGANWQNFLRKLNENRIRLAEKSLKDLLGVKSLQGKRFLDIGSGSGLFSLAAHRLGAVVHSFDFDPASVWCTKELRTRFGKPNSSWQVEEASVLDDAYMSRLGKFDVVYSWGVLHSTNEMWRGILNAARLVPPPPPPSAKRRWRFPLYRHLQ